MVSAHLAGQFETDFFVFNWCGRAGGPRPDARKLIKVEKSGIFDLEIKAIIFLSSVPIKRDAARNIPTANSTSQTSGQSNKNKDKYKPESISLRF